MMNLHPVTLPEMLAARERRQETQTRLLTQFGLPVLSFTMNIAGEIKLSPLIQFAFEEGLQMLLEKLGAPLYQETKIPQTGCEAFWVVSLPAAELKALCLEVEAMHPVGRLFDLDVIGTDGQKRSRSEPRPCLICGGPALPCARSRAHGLDAVLQRTRQLLLEFSGECFARRASDALKEEAALTPKPGLVDRRNNGAHTDMDLPLFEQSAQALKGCFQAAFSIGAHDSKPSQALHAIGIKAERRMMEVTGGINTHRGAIFSFGIVLSAIGRYYAGIGDEESLFSAAAAIATELPFSKAPSHGAEIRRKYGVSGAREEAENGFPSVQKALSLLQDGLPPTDVLLHLIACCPDNNLLHRGGPEGLKFAQECARSVLALPSKLHLDAIREMDDAFIKRNLSPGGCADLLALALFLWNNRDHIPLSR